MNTDQSPDDQLERMIELAAVINRNLEANPCDVMSLRFTRDQWQAIASALEIAAGL